MPKIIKNNLELDLDTLEVKQHFHDYEPFKRTVNEYSGRVEEVKKCTQCEDFFRTIYWINLKSDDLPEELIPMAALPATTMTQQPQKIVRYATSIYDAK